MRCGAFALAVLIAAPALVSCAGARDATEKELSALRSDLTKLRADQARMQERLDALEITRGALRSGGEAIEPAPTTKPIDADRPALDVVRLAPPVDVDDPGDATDSTDSSAPRPMIRTDGSSGSIVDRGVKPIVDRGAKPTPKKKPGSEKKKP